jgi:hypothetical protein
MMEQLSRRAGNSIKFNARFRPYFIEKEKMQE